MVFIVYKQENYKQNCFFYSFFFLLTFTSLLRRPTLYIVYQKLKNIPGEGKCVLAIFITIAVQVYHVRISKLPDEKQYSSKTDKITLTCKGNGNPEPQYEWFKKDNNNIILSKKSFYVIGNVKQNKSGVYICEVYNIIDDVSYRMSNSTEINIGELTVTFYVLFEEFDIYLDWHLTSLFFYC